MVKSLRKRPRADALRSEQRRVTNFGGRALYLAVLAIMGLFGANLLFGDLIFLRADGLLLREQRTVSAPYLAQVEAVEVGYGETVEEGDLILRLQSMEVLERLADLSARNAELAARAVEYEVRARSVAQMTPLAERREAEIAKLLEKYDALYNERTVVSAPYHDALRTRFEAQRLLVQYRAQSEGLRAELDTLAAARQDAREALEELRRRYAGGVVHAPVSGAIGVRTPSVGDVFRPGEPILSIHFGEPYVLAYLPKRYLFPMRKGARVRVRSGRMSAIGAIDEILPVTDVLPVEFQNTFEPRGRSQLARIRFYEPPPFPVHAKLSIGNVSLFDDLFRRDEARR